MQMDTGSEVKLIPRNVWGRIGKATLRKSNLQLCQFHVSFIKTFGFFEGSLALEDKFDVILLTVTTCKKNQGLLGKDMLNINSTKLINEIKMEKKKKIESLKAIKVKLATVVEGGPKAPFSIATTPRCRGGRYSFPWIAPLYP